MLAVAAISARLLAECAALDGLPSIALDLFGDADTCRIAAQWLPIGRPDTLRIDGERLLAALARLARRGDVQGWIAGSGFDGRADLLEQGAARLPLIGTAAADVRRVRDPADFFAMLRANGIAHPEVCLQVPASPAGWLLKDAGGCGGWQVRRADAAGALPTGLGRYWQRECPGLPMSATFIANGRDAVLLGFNAQTTRPLGERPFVFCGVAGPVPVSDAVQRAVSAAARLLAAEYRLRGLGSIDFMLHGDSAEVLEVNPRVPASAGLYPRVGAGGPLRAHLRACLHGELPPPQQPHPLLRGSEIVFAPAPLRLHAAAAALLASWPEARDLPREGTSFAAGEPVCSLVACGSDLAQVKSALAQRHERLLHTLGSPA